MTYKNEKIKVPKEHYKSLLKRLLFTYLKGRQNIVFIAVILMIIGSAMTALQALLMKPIINDIFVDRNQAMLLPIAIAVMMAFVLRGFSSWGHIVLMAKVGHSIVEQIQNELFSKIIRSDMAFFHKQPSGGLISLMVSDAGLMRFAVAEVLTGFGKGFVTLIFLICVMFYQNWQLSCIAFFVFPVAAIIVSKIGKKLRLVSISTQNEVADFSSLLSQSFQGARHIKAYGMEEREEKHIAGNANRLFKLNYKAVRIGGFSTPMSEILTGTAIVAIIMYGGVQVVEGESTPGDFFSFIAAFIMAYEPMKKLAKLNNSMQIGLGATLRVFKVLDTKNKIIDKSNAKKLKINQAEIKFDDVSFTYDDGTVALNNLNLIIPSGKKTALVGPSGGGKSTIINMIPRFYDVTSGAITVDGQDIRDVTMQSLRKNIALVSQEIAIFDSTVFDNIAYGNGDVAQDDVINAAKKAAAHEFIIELQDGYQTRLGENGVKLSGGQRQRISIARAILRNAPILLLDEATSALDTKSERIVHEALEDLQKGRTTLVVAHRLSTIEDADLIYVLKEGNVVESGNHDELLKKKGTYANLYGIQASLV